MIEDRENDWLAQEMKREGIVRKGVSDRWMDNASEIKREHELLHGQERTPSFKGPMKTSKNRSVLIILAWIIFIIVFIMMEVLK